MRYPLSSRKLLFWEMALALCLFVMPAAAQSDPAPLTAEDVFAPNIEIRYIQPEATAEPMPTATPFVSPCPGVGMIEETPYFEWWFIGQNGGALCHVLTGERISPPTEGGVSFEHQFDRARGLDRVFTLSPDKRFLVFSGRLSQPVEADQRLHNFALYAYDVVDGVFRRLGTIPYLQRSETITWNGTKLVFLLADGIDSQAEKRIYLADATLEESSELLFETYLQIEYYDNPPRIETLPYIGGGGIVCGKHVYDLMTKQMTTYDYGQTLCRPDYGSFEGVGYFREIIRRDDGSSIAQVARIDGRTGQQIRMWTGEIERVLWVAEDNSVGILLIDNDGRIAVHPDVADYFAVQMRVPVSALTQYPAVEPLATSVVYPRIGYSPPTIWTETWDAPPAYGIYALPDGSFADFYCDPGICGYQEEQGIYMVNWIFDDEGESWLPQQKLDRLTIVDGEAVRTHLHDAAITLTPDRKGAFVWTQPNNGFPRDAARQGISIYDFETGHVTPLTREFDQPAYSLSVFLHAVYGVSINVTGLNGSSAGGTVLFDASGQPYVERRLRAGEEIPVRPTDAPTATPSLTPTITPTPTATMAPTSTPSFTPTITLTPTITPMPRPSCALTVLTGANLRAGPAVETEKVGSAAVDFVLTAVGQAENTQDFFTWWQLDTDEWIREDFVREGEGCEALPTVQP